MVNRVTSPGIQRNCCADFADGIDCFVIPRIKASLGHTLHMRHGSKYANRRVVLFDETGTGHPCMGQAEDGQRQTHLLGVQQDRFGLQFAP